METTATKKILVIDDEVDLASMIAFQFKSKGFEAHTAFDGVDALSKVHQIEPDLIILDINMPRMGGIEFYSKICATNGKPLYPVLILTARANIQGLFQDLHIDGFMIKPFDIDQLIHEGETIIKKRKQEGDKKAMAPQQIIRKVCIADDHPSFNEISQLFLNADYTVVPAKSGAQAIERMMKDVPDVALIYLGLNDIPGDTVIFRLSQMAKTMDVKFVLYTSKSAEHDKQVMDRIRTKTGILTFVEYSNPQELLEATNSLFVL